MIRIFNSDDKERRKRIKESQDILVSLPYRSFFLKGKMIPLKVFEKHLSEYKDDIRVGIGDDMIILVGYKYNPDRYNDFIEALQLKKVYYSKLYKDLDGKITQTSFKKL